MKRIFRPTITACHNVAIGPETRHTAEMMQEHFPHRHETTVLNRHDNGTSTERKAPGACRQYLCLRASGTRDRGALTSPRGLRLYWVPSDSTVSTSFSMSTSTSCPVFSLSHSLTSVSHGYSSPLPSPKRPVTNGFTEMSLSGVYQST